MFKSKKTAWLTIVALLVPTTIGLFGSSAAQADASSTSLSTFTVNGTDALTANSINLDVSTLNVDAATGSLSTDIVAIASDAGNTTVSVVGGNNLRLGANALTVTVHDTTVDSVVADTVYTRNLNVQNNDTSAVIVLNNDELINGESTETDWGVTSVPLVVTPTDPNATVKVNGIAVSVVNGKATTSVTGLTSGDNSVSVVVTAANGEYDESIFNVLVNLNTDTGATFTVDGILADDGETIPLDYGTTDPDIEVITSDPNASFVIEGGSDLITGENPVAIYVTAEDGVTTQTYNLTFIVMSNNDTTATIYVNGVAADDGSDVSLAYQTSAVTVRVELADSDASYIIDGGTWLTQGQNDLIVTVIAADGVTFSYYAINLVVADPDVTLSTLKFNGATVADQGTVSTSSLQNTLTLITTDSRATVSVEGAISYNALTGAITLDYGRNDLAITVTGDDKATTREYDIVVSGPADLSLESVMVGGEDVVLNGLTGTVTLEEHPTSALVEVSTVDAQATYRVTGGNNLVLGNNTVTVVVTGTDQRTATYTITVSVLASTNEEIASVSVNGRLVEEGDLAEVDAGVLNLHVQTADSRASSSVTVAPTEGAAGWVSTINGVTTGSGYLTVSVVVTAENGVIAQPVTYDILATRHFDVTSSSYTEPNILRVGKFAVISTSTAASWFPSKTKLTYQWLLNNEVIDVATKTRLALTADYFGTENVVRPVVSGTVNGVLRTYVGQPLTISKGIIARSSKPGVSGKATLGSTLTATARTWSADVVTSFNWQVNGQNVGNSSDEFTLDQARYVPGDRITVQVTGQLYGYEDKTETSSVFTVLPGVLKITGKPTISADNTYVTGSTITATNGSTDAGASVNVQTNFQWYRNGVAIQGATAAAYKIVSADVAQKLSVVVSYSTRNYTSASMTLKVPTIKK
ncbi:MAG: hypothetical protein EBS85_05475 [Micrococcales bacterium]|nr:hypothetical protein [Actinomycetota bacterium]NCA08157.1 hypothetical protein [Micrococcales bacterium]